MSMSKKLKSLADWKEISEGQLRLYDKQIEDIIGKFPETVKEKKKKFATTEFDRSLTRIGLEVEVENLEEGPIKTFWWSAKGDSSLRNFGYELFSAFPYQNQEQVSFALEEMNAFLKKLKEHEFSWRTCIQVHADMTQFNIVELCRFILLYCLLEPLLFKVFSEQRRNSVYCVPLFESDFFTNKKDTGQLSGIFHHAQKDEDVNWATLISKIWPDKMSKYSAINFSRLSDLCTVEFRQLPGTNDMEKVSDWISVILLILKKAKKTESFNDLIKEIKEISGHQDYLESIFGDKTKLLVFSPHFDKYLNEGVKKSKELISLTSKEVKAMTKISSKGEIVSHFKTVNEKREARIKRTFS